MRASLQQQELPSRDLAVQQKPVGAEITAQDGAQDEYVEGGTPADASSLGASEPSEPPPH